VADPPPQPAGFGACGGCPYRDVGSAAICYWCASQTMEPLAPLHCDVCGQTLAPAEQCRNYWCRRSIDERYFLKIRAIAMRTGILEAAINAYKFSDDQQGWASIFGRVLVGYLDQHASAFGIFDLIVATPAYTGPGARRSWDHVRLILERAAIEATPGRWPFDLATPPAIVKTADTPSMAKSAGAGERRSIAAGPLRAALSVPDPSRVRGRLVLVVDDIFTDGTTLTEVARALRLAGAAPVGGLVLARQPWR
jgi:predicted amidophosphoribosyltransferase